ncbi:MAG: hypothetical protein H6617_02660 [Bdellovibrionaceae bacterium]|nr:hypothetical protein [Pseudobdellovibrionaceae bacterium]
MSKYLSVDTEATGLTNDCHLIQLAFVPVDVKARKVVKELGKETLVKCPSFESLEPNLNSWVLKHMKSVIVDAAEKGIEPSSLNGWVETYLESEPVKEFFQGELPLVLLGKSLSALDIPILRKYLGESFYSKYFHHHTIDVTSVAKSFVDCGLLPPGHASGGKLVRYLDIADQVQHTALSDAIDMGEIYVRLIERSVQKVQSSELDTAVVTEK